MKEKKNERSFSAEIHVVPLQVFLRAMTNKGKNKLTDLFVAIELPFISVTSSDVIQRKYTASGLYMFRVKF